MKLNEAKKILKNNGYIVEDAYTDAMDADDDEVLRKLRNAYAKTDAEYTPDYVPKLDKILLNLDFVKLHKQVNKHQKFNLSYIGFITGTKYLLNFMIDSDDVITCNVVDTDKRKVQKVTMDAIDSDNYYGEYINVNDFIENSDYYLDNIKKVVENVKKIDRSSKTKLGRIANGITKALGNNFDTRYSGLKEIAENAAERMAVNSYEGQVDEIAETIEKVKHVKNYYEVDPDEDFIKAQFEIVMQDDTVWEVQFRRGRGFWWRGNVYPWRIIKETNGGFVNIAFSMRMLKSYMKKVKAIQIESVNESSDDYREIVTKKLAKIYDRCYDSDDYGRSYAEKQVADFEPQIAEVLEEGGDSPISPYEVAEVIWYILHHSQLQGKSILDVYMRYTRNEPDFFETWHEFN